MQYFREKLNSLTSYFVKKVEENKNRKVTKYEIYLEHIYRILSWEDNAFTLGIFLLCNFVFWVVVLFEIKPIGIFFFTLLMVFLFDSFYETRNYSTYHLQHAEAIDDICNYFLEIRAGIILLKKESPSTFCFGAFIFFLFLSVIANKISGYLLMYIFLLELFFIPPLFKILPEEYSTAFKNLLRSFCNVKDVLAEEELIPFIANKDFTIQDVDLDSLLTDKTADSATNSLASGISAMPSYLDVAENRDDIEEEDLIPNRAKSHETPLDQGELSSDSDSENRDMKFDSTHFNGDSSSEEEKLLGKGLKFVDLTEKITPNMSKSESNFGGMLSNLATMSSSLLTVALQSAVKSTSVEKENSSSDSEFEIINSDDVK